MARSPRPPWERPNPRKAKRKAGKHLSSKQKAAAKARARRAGRHYPNLVDNMAVAAKGKRGDKAAAKRKSSKQASHRKAAPKRTR